MLRYIFHISDLHIRNGDKKYSRYDEYNNVFNETITSLNKNITNMNLSKSDFLIIITGDIFHNKNNIGNYGLLLYKNFLSELIKIGKVIIIHGNHDKIQSDLKQPSLVFSSTFQNENLIVLNESTSFVIDEIGFSYVCVDDTLDFNSNSGRLAVLPKFPDIAEEVRYKVALFHGTFSKSKLYNGDLIHEENNPYPLEWVKDFDYALLGDIHKRQTDLYNKKTRYGYSGSLIQQNFGEDILDHGYLIWDLYGPKSTEVTEVNVYNDIGYINIKQDENEDILIRINGKYEVLLENVIKESLEIFPKCLEIKAFSNFNFEKLNTLLGKYNISYSIISRNIERSLIKDYQSVNNLGDSDSIASVANVAGVAGVAAVANVANDEYILSYFNKILPPDKYAILVNIIKNKESLLLNTNKYSYDLHDECSKRNKDINASIISCNKSLELNTNKDVFLVKYLEWEGLLCYENKNWINMHDLDSKTFMVRGKNGTGKSAIYDILLLAIWGDNTKMKVKGNTSLSAGMINHKKDKAYTIVDIELNGKLYRIERDYAKRKDSNTLHHNHSYIHEFINDKELVLLMKESACNDEVKKLFGTMDDFLTTSMITQNVDNDILKFESKKCLELIDKSYNIDYIYNLYNLFKITINKYRDFNRTIENKKQVYQKLVSSNQVSDISEEELKDLTREQARLNDEKSEVVNLFNAITIDIRNPKNITILNTDYDEPIKKIIDIYGSFNDDEMMIKKDRYTELRSILKDGISLSNLRTQFSTEIDDELKNMMDINKPCELYILQNEEEQLKEYLNIDYTDSNSLDITALEQELISHKKQRSELENKLTELVVQKTLRVDKPNASKAKCHQEIIKYFKTIKSFDTFISTNKNTTVTTVTTANEDVKEDDIVLYKTYKELITFRQSRELKLSDNKVSLLKLEETFKDCFSKQQAIATINKPTDIINNKKIKLASHTSPTSHTSHTSPTATSISKELNKIDMEVVTKSLKELEDKLQYYNDVKKTIDDLELSYSNYNQELSQFNNNDDYKYNPECEVCCKRPWVNRIKELEIIINKINDDINANKSLYDGPAYNSLVKNIEKNNDIIENHSILVKWLDYYNYKEAYDKISEELNKIIADKEYLNKETLSLQEELLGIANKINKFNNKAYTLYNLNNTIIAYDKYQAWEENYNTITAMISDLNNTIKDCEFKLNYNKNIRPRIDKYNTLKIAYEEWEAYDLKLRIVRAEEYYNLKTIIDDYDKYISYVDNNKSKELIKQKLELNEIIKDKDKLINILNEKQVKFSTLNTYNKDNKDNYNLLLEASNDLTDIIDTLDTIIINFQSFRIELYEKYILKNLVSNTNNIIKNLCHSDTKPFKLDYMLNVSKDIIHINWLIADETNMDTKIISITQSSGFQHFTISTAIRMCLFLNKNTLYCNQLFIDEGFVSFDKFNLSIVPSFLKNLLSYFNTIVVVSHIDLIQDNIDDYVSINYNKANSISTIEYERYKKVVKTRRRIIK
jgi:DNA repair exonuclease SbcCD ATPase subunit